MSESEHEGEVAATKSTAKKAMKKVVAPAKKPEEYREAAEKELGPIAKVAYDFMCMKPSVQASYIKWEDVNTGDREDILTFGKENWVRPDEVSEDKKWTQTGALDDTIKSLSKLAPRTGDDDDRANYMKRHMGVWATVKMPDRPEIEIMGYLTSAATEEPRQFHPFASKQLPVVHNKNFDRLAHLQDETVDLETLEFEGDVTFDYPEFDMRFCVQKWLENQRIAATKAAAAAASAAATTKEDGEDSEMKDAAADPIEEEGEKEEEAAPKKTATKKKTMGSSSSSSATGATKTNGKKLAATLDDPVLVEMERRCKSAARELAKILHNPDSATRAAILGPITDPPLSVEDNKRLSSFPDSFHVDKEFLNDPEKLHADNWETRPVCMAIMASSMAFEYSKQGPLAYAAERNIPPRSDTIQNWISTWENHSLGGTWDSGVTVADIADAGRFVQDLALAGSATMKRGMAFRMAAQLTLRVLRIREVTTCAGFPGIYCCETNEPIAEGTKCDAWDLELNPAYLPEGMSHTMTLLVKQKASKACPLFPRKKTTVIAADGSKSPVRPKSPGKKQSAPVTVDEKGEEEEEKKVATPKKPSKKAAAPAAPANPFVAAAAAGSKKRKTPEKNEKDEEEEEKEEEVSPSKPKKAKLEKEAPPKKGKSSNLIKKFVPEVEFINVWPKDMVVHGTALWHAFKQCWIEKKLEEDKDFVNMIGLVMSENDAEIRRHLLAMSKASLWAVFDMILEFIKPRTAVADLEAEMLAATKEPDVDTMDFMDLLDMVGGGQDGEALTGTNNNNNKKMEYRTDLPEPSSAIFTLYKNANLACEAGKRPENFPLIKELFPTPDSVFKNPNTLYHMAFVALFSD